MNNLDIPFPETEFLYVEGLKEFNLIYPYDHPLSLAIKIDMMVRTLSFSDPEYADFLSNRKKPSEMTPIGGKLLEIKYIRDCSVRDVAKFEWRDNYGPNTPQDFLGLARNCDLDSFVKIIHLKTPDYSLKSFNNKYSF